MDNASISLKRISTTRLNHTPIPPLLHSSNSVRKMSLPILYVNVPKYYTWCPNTKKYSQRSQGTPVEGVPGIKASDALGRVYTVHPNNFECFCLRLLLHSVDGPTSFHDLRTVIGHICETFREACNKRDLLEDDNHWNATLQKQLLRILPTNSGTCL